MPGAAQPAPKAKAKAKAKAAKPRRTPPPGPSWRTTDEVEIAQRKQRAKDEPMLVMPLDGGRPPFADYFVRRKRAEVDAAQYVVEVRALGPAAGGNWCSCPDFTKAGLGTCKHLEAVLRSSYGGRRDRHAGSPFVEIHLGAEGEPPVLRLPPTVPPEALAFLAPFRDPTGNWRAPWAETLAVLRRDLASATDAVRAAIRLSRGVAEALDRYAVQQALAQRRHELQARFDAAAYLKLPLYPYQVEGMFHLAFTGRAMLADEMGLGKTVQAIGAACLLRDLCGIRRVLIVCPVSLKAEWEEQLAKFTGQQATLVMGLRPQRLATYRQPPSQFVVCNYEQVLHDVTELNDVLQPDLVILDEAQRIKNWKTRTARQVKRLRSRFAFVLTGTPLENRIDEVYSLAEFLEPRLFGSLFRFNREFYRFDERGRVAGVQHLERLHQRLAPIMLRRRKDQIAEQLPERVDNHYYVELTAEQRSRYHEYEDVVARLAHQAKRRPLTPPEFERLQRSLACMRMLCDSCYILDDQVTAAPKLDELERVLADLWAEDPTRKVIVFSEWERMLLLLRTRCEAAGHAFAWHTGSVPQAQRRDELRRFKSDPACRLFLSTEAGGVGLNLQAASVVVNLDLPWNPAKLEQRIARAWRKHQQRSVHVINFVALDSIEHRMLGTLGYKKALADAVLDARGDVAALEQEGGRERLLRRLDTLMQAAPADEPAPPAVAAAPPAPPPLDLLRQELAIHLAARGVAAMANADAQATPRRLLLVGGRPEALRQTVAECAARAGVPVGPDAITVLTPEQYSLLHELAAQGFIEFTPAAREKLWENPNWAPAASAEHDRRRALVEPLLATLERPLRLGEVLLGNGFADEALPSLRQALEALLRAAWALHATPLPTALPASLDATQTAALAAETRWAPLVALARRLAAAPPIPDDLSAAPGLLRAALSQLHTASTRLGQD